MVTDCAEAPTGADEGDNEVIEGTGLFTRAEPSLSEFTAVSTAMASLNNSQPRCTACPTLAAIFEEVSTACTIAPTPVDMIRIFTAMLARVLTPAVAPQVPRS